MNNYETITISTQESVVYVELNRPEVHNAFDDRMIAELKQVFQELAKNSEIRVLVLSGKGKSFCAGADMNWMRRMKNFNYEENFQDAYQLSEMLYQLYSLPIPTIAKIQGPTIGGGVGLVATCDIAVASSNVVFSLSEVRLGLVPACISPYLLKRIPQGILRGYFLTGIRFPASKAKEIGLINEVVRPEQLDGSVNTLVKKILSCGPHAIQSAKELLDRVPQMSTSEWMKYTAELIANLRISEEGQEGLSAFLEKRNPSWYKEEEE